MRTAPKIMRWSIVFLFFSFFAYLLIFTIVRDVYIEDACKEAGFVNYRGQDTRSVFCIDSDGFYHLFNTDCNWIGTDCTLELAKYKG